MIATIFGKEVFQRRVLLALALALVCALAALMPFWFSFGLSRGVRAVSSDTAQAMLANFRSYAVFVEDWCGRGLARTLCLLALLGGAGAIAGEREERTLPLLRSSAIPLGYVVAIKFFVVALWLLLVAFASTAVLAALSLVAHLTLPLSAIVVASLVAWCNAVAFLAVVFFASALAPLRLVAAVAGLALGGLVAAALAPFGFNGSALGVNLFDVDGSLHVANAVDDACIAALIAVAGFTAAIVAAQQSHLS